MATVTQLIAPKGILTDFSDSLSLQSHLAPISEAKEARADIPLPPVRTPVADVLDKDKGTPDAHVTRDPRLIRLTGTHPFNAESPLTPLYGEGFITSVDLFYVRNHGAVPEVFEDEVWSWEFSVEGLVQNPFTLSLRQLVEEFEQVTLPITLVCAGNRRKEQNTVRKSKGFSWGAAGLSTALFTGTLMANVLKKARPIRGAKYLCMEGADQLPNGRYGTSVKLNWAMNPDRGIMLAHGMNGAPLRADHGRPLRAVVPGQIGGRSVKWLRRLVVTAEPSDNWYHYHDNKVLPTTVTPEQSAAEPHWWKDERYAIYDLNVNSAVVHPQHDEVLNTLSSGADYAIRGYAYSGGGRRVTRVEISLDSGKSWRLAHVEYPEDKYRDADMVVFGGRLDMSTRETCFCWCFWSYTLPVYELQNADSIVVRAMDEAMMVQPRDMYWSVLGMMNNPWFRVSISRGEGSLRFEHPTSLDPRTSGWMDKVKGAGGDLTNGRWGERDPGDDQPVTPPSEEICMTNQDVKRVFTLGEFMTESSQERPLFVVNGEVYDGGTFLGAHPGGAQSIVAVAATDATEEFMAIHSENAKAMMREYHVGSLDGAGRQSLCSPPDSVKALSPSRPVFLNARSWAKAVLAGRRAVSPDSKLLTFKLDHADQQLGLPVGQHLMLRLKDPATAESVIRAYTPLSDDTRRGVLDLLVKLYLPTSTTAGGRMTTLLDGVPLGTSLEFKGPVGRFTYLGRGVAAVGGETRQVGSFVMICGGSGITPVFQVFRAVMRDAGDATFCTVLYGNRTEEDILCREELEGLAGLRKGGCRVVHTLSRPSEGWTGLRGRISEELLRKEAAPRERAMALVCGPPAMETSAREKLLGIGWGGSDMVFF